MTRMQTGSPLKYEGGGFTAFLLPKAEMVGFARIPSDRPFLHIIIQARNSPYDIYSVVDVQVSITLVTKFKPKMRMPDSRTS